MRPSTWRLDDLRNVILNLGFVGENLHTRIIIDCKKMFDQYPNASVSMTVTPPEGDPYPGMIERDGDLVIWDVRDCDLVAEGDGEIQIVFTQEPHIARSYNARTHVCRSQVPTGDVPSGLEDFVTRADQLLDQVENTFPAGGTTGQVLAKKSDTDYDTEWVDQGAGGTSDYDELENRPQIGGVTLTGNKSLHDLGAAAESDIPDPTSIIDDTAGDGDTNKVWSADKSSALLTQINSKADEPTGTKSAGKVYGLDSNLKPVWTDQGGGGSTADCVKKNGTDEVTAKNLQIVQKTYSPNLYNTETITDGIYLNPANGSENAHSSYMTTDYIPVEAGEKYYGTWQWKLDPTRRDMMLNFVTCYNESKEVMGSVGMTSPSNPITIPTGVAYIRISQSNSDYYEYRQFEKGEEGTHYYPYMEILDEVIKDQYMPEVSMRQIPAFELVDGLNLFNSNDPNYEPGKFLTTNGSVSDNSSYATSGYIKVEPGDYIVFAYYIPQFDINNVASMRTIACYDADKNNLSTKGIYSSNTFDVPSGVSYVRICWHSGTYGTNVQIQKVAPYESFYPQYKTYEEPHYELKRDYMYGMPGKPEHVFLPSEIYVAVGRTIELYNEQIVLDHEKYHFVWICGEGYAYKRKFSITGSIVGNKSLTLELYDDKKNLCWRGVCTIHVVSASNPSVKILPIGDSLTNWKAWLQETMLLSSQSVEFVGTRFSGESVDSEGNVYARGTIHSEGRSGFSAGNYLADTSYTFDDRYDGVGTVSGTANPFWDGSKFSLNHYLTTQTGVSTPDAVQLFLGTNDLTNGVETAINNIVALVTSIRSEYSTLPIFVCNTIFRSNQNGYGSAGNDAYVGGGGAGAWQYEQDTRVMDLMVGLRKRLADVTGVTFIPLASCMDREYGFGQVMTKVNPRCAVEVPMPEESVHPVASGYYQMADLMYSTYCGVLS